MKKSLADRVVTLAEKTPGKESEVCDWQMDMRKLTSFIGLSFLAYKQYTSIITVRGIITISGSLIQIQGRVNGYWILNHPYCGQTGESWCPFGMGC